MAAAECYEAWQRCLVAHHLRHAEEGCLEGGGAACHHGERGVGEQGVGVVVYETHASAFYEAAVLSGINARCAGEHELVVVKAACCLNHGRQVVGYLLTAAAGEEGYDGLL